jgi:hypothetical protein
VESLRLSPRVKDLALVEGHQVDDDVAWSPIEEIPRLPPKPLSPGALDLDFIKVGYHYVICNTHGGH